MTDYTARIQIVEGEPITEERLFNLLLAAAADVAAQKIIEGGGFTNLEDATAYLDAHNAEILDWARRLITHPDTFAALVNALRHHSDR